MTDQPPRQSGSDPIGEFQRWLVRSSARSVTRQLSGQIRTALGGGKQRSSDVWETATSDYDEAPECAWCPICRARRRLRESGPGLGSGVAAAADAVGVVMQDAMSAFEAAVAAAGRQTRPKDSAAPPADQVWDEATDEPAVPIRPTGNGGPTRPASTRPPSPGAKRPSAAPKKPPATPAKPAATQDQPTAGTDQPPAATNPDDPTG